MPTYKYPGVYTEEISVSGHSVAEVASSIPAFIGYTEKAMEKKANDLFRKPTRIASMQEYETYFGGAHAEDISVDVDGGINRGFTARITNPDLKYLLHYCMQQFFGNGGGRCYIVSAGDYTEAITDTALVSCLAAVSKLDEPTLIVIPEAVNISRPSGYANVV